MNCVLKKFIQIMKESDFSDSDKFFAVNGQEGVTERFIWFHSKER